MEREGRFAPQRAPDFARRFGSPASVLRRTLGFGSPTSVAIYSTLANIQKDFIKISPLTKTADQED